MPVDGIPPDKSREEKFRRKEVLHEQSAGFFRMGNILSPFSAVHEKRMAQKIPQITDTPMQVAAVNGRSFTATRNQVKNPVTAIASAFENSHPLSSNPSKSLPVTGMATIPINSARSHQVQNVHTSPPRRYAESAIRITAAMDSGSIFLICIFIVLPPVSDSVAKADKISKCLSADLYDAFHINRIFTCLTRTECNRYILHMQMMLLINYRHQNIGKKKIRPGSFFSTFDNCFAFIRRYGVFASFTHVPKVRNSTSLSTLVTKSLEKPSSLFFL